MDMDNLNLPPSRAAAGKKERSLEGLAEQRDKGSEVHRSSGEDYKSLFKTLASFPGVLPSHLAYSAYTLSK